MQIDPESDRNISPNLLNHTGWLPLPKLIISLKEDVKVDVAIIGENGRDLLCLFLKQKV